MERKVANLKKFPAFARVEDTKINLTGEQLAAIGSIAMNYNEMEGYIDVLLWHTCNLPAELLLEVSTRINGIDGKLEIIKRGARLLGLNESETGQLENLLGGNWFVRLKRLRDAVIHARVLNVPLGVGIRVDRRARLSEVFLRLDALQALDEHICAVRLALHEAGALLMAARYLADCECSNPDRAPREALLQACLARFQVRLSHLSSLPRLPELPSEQEMTSAGNAWLKAQIEAQMAKPQGLDQENEGREPQVTTL